MKLVLLFTVIIGITQGFTPQRTVTYSYMIDFDTYCNYTLMPNEYNNNDMIGIEIWSSSFQNYMRTTKETNQRPINIYIDTCHAWVDNTGFTICTTITLYRCGRIIVYFNDVVANTSSSSISPSISHICTASSSTSMEHVYMNSSQSTHHDFTTFTPYESLIVSIIVIGTIIVILVCMCVVFAVVNKNVNIAIIDSFN
jgi:hypothetical protein